MPKGRGFRRAISMNLTIKETLEKQLQILSERSIRERGEILPDLTRVMIEIAKYLDSEPNNKAAEGIQQAVTNAIDRLGTLGVFQNPSENPKK